MVQKVNILYLATAFMLCTQFLPMITSKKGNLQKLRKDKNVGELPHLETGKSVNTSYI
jgi:hypothetical protein